MEKVEKFVKMFCPDLSQYLFEIFQDELPDDFDEEDFIEIMREKECVEEKWGVTLWENGPETITVKFFEFGEEGIVWWEEYANSENCETQGAEGSYIIALTAKEFNDQLQKRNIELNE